MYLIFSDFYTEKKIIREIAVNVSWDTVETLLYTLVYTMNKDKYTYIYILVFVHCTLIYISPLLIVFTICDLRLASIARISKFY